MVEPAFPTACAISAPAPRCVRRAGGREELLSVYDNGVGMRPGEARNGTGACRRGKIGTQANDSIGLVNVNARIRPFYGGAYGVRLRAAPGSSPCDVATFGPWRQGRTSWAGKNLRGFYKY